MKIETDVPLPNAGSRDAETWAKMGIGDSIKFDTDPEAEKAAQQLTAWCRSNQPDLRALRRESRIWLVTRAHYPTSADKPKGEPE